MVALNQEPILQKLTLLFILFIAALQAQMVDGVAILVKEEPITLYDIEQKMDEGHLTQQQAVDLLIREQLESQEIKQRELSVSATELQERISNLAQQNGMSLAQLYDAVWRTEHLTQSAFEERMKKTMLKQKLYSAIAMANLEEPSEEEMREYYRLHSELFSHSETFNVTVYRAPARGVLQRKMANPMLNLSEVTTQDAVLPYAQLEPRLTELLSKTQNGAFTPILSDPKGGFVSFFVHSRSLPVMVPFEQVKMQVQEALMAEKREQTLKDYFDRARLNAEIKTIRLPE
jgi:hypothetical protein